MFAQPRAKKTLAPPPKKRKAAHSVEEISFDNDARADYLTGFHKRKQARIKHAQEIAVEKARKERIEARRQLREGRKRDVEQHVEQVNALLREARNAGHDHDASSGDEFDDAWGGFKDAPALPDAQPINVEEEYIDEDKFTTVTIESVNIDRDGLHRPAPGSSEDDDDDNAAAADGKRDRDGASDGSGKSKEKTHPTKKKKKFRYESKFDRQQTARKSKAKKMAR